MISALTGELREVDDDRVHLQVGPMLFELMVPAADVSGHRLAVGREITFHTVFYLEGDSSGGNIEPRLIGFVRPNDRDFFQLFITVKGIGPKKALKALIMPVGQIAHAIETKNSKVLCELPQIGKRMAELIVAELSGKVEAFALQHAHDRGIQRTGSVSPRTQLEEDAIAALVALGERRSDAEALLDRTKHANPNLKTTNELVSQMLRLRGTR
jgi:Holliday junction DNA helicase RuvA